MYLLQVSHWYCHALLFSQDVTYNMLNCLNCYDQDRKVLLWSLTYYWPLFGDWSHIWQFCRLFGQRSYLLIFYFGGGNRDAEKERLDEIKQQWCSRQDCQAWLCLTLIVHEGWHGCPSNNHEDLSEWFLWSHIYCKFKHWVLDLLLPVHRGIWCFFLCIFNAVTKPSKTAVSPLLFNTPPVCG